MKAGKRNRKAGPPLAASGPPPAPDDSGAADISDVREQSPLLCEVAWEVCQQVGGIYTVLRSKVPSTIRRWGKRYMLLGPYDPAVSPLEFEETPATGTVGLIVKQLAAMGIEVHHGRWLITGQPRVVLMNPRSVYGRLHEIKYFLWEHHGIPLPAHDPLVDGVAAFGFCVEQFFRAAAAQRTHARPIIAHFHEWMGGSAIPELRRAGLPLSIVFTTHATSLGRYLAMNDPWFYDHVPFVDWEADAKRFNIEPQVRIERAAAHGCHLFTTVSDITAFECEYLLGRKPDMLLPNGINIERFVAVHEFQNLHRVYREHIERFVMGHFFPSYTFDLDRTLYFFTSGRYEYRNKGFDITLEALARLNHQIRRTGLDRTIVFFLLAKRPYRSVNAEVLRSRMLMEEMRNNCEQIQSQLGERLFRSVAMGRWPQLETLVEDYWRLRLRRQMHAWRSGRLPSIVTHDLVDQNDEVLTQMRSSMLINLPDDPVKVVYFPDFITPNDPLFGMEYDQFVRGCHLGIFPSAYEPWGYTPLECAARGVPAITSDLAGFGTYLLKNMRDHNERGLYVLLRRYKSHNDAADQLAQWLFEFAALERRERIDLRNRVESSCDQFDWSNLGRYYAEAYERVRETTGL